MLRDQALRGGTVEVGADTPPSDSSGRSSAAPAVVDDRAVDALEPQLVTRGALAARPRPVARLDPGPRERLVVEHAESPSRAIAPSTSSGR